MPTKKTIVRHHERRTKTGRTNVIRHNRTISTGLRVGMTVQIVGTQYTGQIGKITAIASRHGTLSKPYPILVKLAHGTYAFNRSELKSSFIIPKPRPKPVSPPKPRRTVPPTVPIVRPIRTPRRTQSSPLDFFQSMRTPRKPTEFYGVHDGLEENRTSNAFMFDASHILGKLKDEDGLGERFRPLYDYWQRAKSLPITGYRIIKYKKREDTRIVFKNTDNDYLVINYALLRGLKRNIVGRYKAYFVKGVPLFIQDTKNIYLVAPMVGDVFDYSVKEAKRLGL